MAFPMDIAITIPPDPPETGISRVFLGIRISKRTVLRWVKPPWRYVFIPTTPKSPVKTCAKRSVHGLSLFVGGSSGDERGLLLVGTFTRRRTATIPRQHDRLEIFWPETLWRSTASQRLAALLSYGSVEGPRPESQLRMIHTSKVKIEETSAGKTKGRREYQNPDRIL